MLATINPQGSVSATAQVHTSVGMTPLGQDKSVVHYQPADLRLGSAVDVHGRRFFLHDCDAFTRQYYQACPRA